MTVTTNSIVDCEDCRQVPSVGAVDTTSVILSDRRWPWSFSVSFFHLEDILSIENHFWQCGLRKSCQKRVPFWQRGAAQSPYADVPVGDKIAYYDRSLKLPLSLLNSRRGWVGCTTVLSNDRKSQNDTVCMEGKMRNVYREGVHFEIFCRLRERSYIPPPPSVKYQGNGTFKVRSWCLDLFHLAKNLNWDLKMGVKSRPINFTSYFFKSYLISCFYEESRHTQKLRSSWDYNSMNTAQLFKSMSEDNSSDMDSDSSMTSSGSSAKSVPDSTEIPSSSFQTPG